MRLIRVLAVSILIVIAVCSVEHVSAAFAGWNVKITFYEIGVERNDLGDNVFHSLQPLWAGPAGIGIGDVAPDFQLPEVTANGLADHLVSLHDFRGKVVVLEFMVPWSQPCQEMAQVLSYFNEKYSGQDVVLLSVAATIRGATAESTSGFMRENGSTWTHVLVVDNSVLPRYCVSAVPTYFIVDISERIVAKIEGISSVDALSSAVDTTLSRVTLSMRADLIMGIIGAILAVIAFVLLLQFRRRSASKLKTEITKRKDAGAGEEPTRIPRPDDDDARYIEYLAKLEELKNRGEISEQTYSALRDEYWKRFQKQT